MSQAHQNTVTRLRVVAATGKFSTVAVARLHGLNAN
jgi:hypothetical protein